MDLALLNVRATTLGSILLSPAEPAHSTYDWTNRAFIEQRNKDVVLRNNYLSTQRQVIIVGAGTGRNIKRNRVMLSKTRS